MSADFTRFSQYITYNVDGYIFSLNGATMDSDGLIELKYVVQYLADKLVDVEVVTTASYPMIQTSSLDGCQKTQRQYTVNPSQRRDYVTKVLSYNQILINQQKQSYQNYDKDTAAQLT